MAANITVLESIREKKAKGADVITLYDGDNRLILKLDNFNYNLKMCIDEVQKLVTKLGNSGLKWNPSARLKMLRKNGIV